MKQRPILCTCNKSGAIWSFWYVYTGSNHLTYLRVTKWCYVKYTLFGDLFYFFEGGGYLLNNNKGPCCIWTPNLWVIRPKSYSTYCATPSIGKMNNITIGWNPHAVTYCYKKCNSHGVSRTLNRNDWLIIYLLNLQCWRAILEYLQGILDFLTIRLSWTNYILFVYSTEVQYSCIFKVVNIVAAEFELCEPNTDFTAFFPLKPIYHWLIDWSTASSEIIHFGQYLPRPFESHRDVHFISHVLVCILLN